MAKITARGCHEVARFRSKTGEQYLVRSDGVVLSKSSMAGDGWTAHGVISAGMNHVIRRDYRSPNRVEAALRWLRSMTGPLGTLEEVT